MTVHKEQPTSGQFVIVWLYEGQVWSKTGRINEADDLEIYEPDFDSYRHAYDNEFKHCEKLRYVTYP